MVLHISDVDQLTPKAHDQVSKQGGRFGDHGMALLETTTLQSVDYGNSLPSHNREEYAKVLAEFNNALQNLRNRHETIPITFVDPIRPKEVCYIKENGDVASQTMKQRKPKKLMSADVDEPSQLS